MDKQLKLGLDLQGGVHLVLRVQTDDALRLATEQEMERLREELTTRSVTVATSTSPIRRIRVEGVPPAQDAASARRRPKCRRTSTAAPARAAPTRSR